MRWKLPSLARAAFLVGIVLVTVLSVVPQPAPVPAEGIDKIEHALAYFLLGVSGMIGYRHRFSILAVVAALAAYGCAMEGVQYFLPTRVAGVADIVANLTGLALALGVVGALRYRGRLRSALNRNNG